MYNPQDIVDEMVVLLKAIPALVTALGGDASVITAFEDSYPENTDLTAAVQELPHPSLLVAWSGAGGVGAGRRWIHEVSLFPGLPEEVAPPYTAMGAIWHAIANGRATTRAEDVPIWGLDILPGASAIGPPAMRRRSVYVGIDHRFDYWEIQFQIEEHAENF